MNETNRKMSAVSDEAVEALLGSASPRPVPPPAETEAVRESVRAEWQQVTTTRRARFRMFHLAAAASVLIAVFVSLNMLRTGGIEPVQVATLDKRFGTIYVLGENSALVSGNNLQSIVTGQTLITGDDSGMGLDWGEGGSLRIDQDTRVEFVSAKEIFLHSGQVYFDSAPALAVASVSGSDARLIIKTVFGDVTHVGTRYMTHADMETLTISVRDGAVRVDDAGGSTRADRNQQLAISGNGARQLLTIKPHGPQWAWVEQTAPSARLDGRTVSEFLDWVGRETGLEVRYETPAARMYAEQEVLNGTLETGPREALSIWMLGTDLGWSIDENGVIYVEQAR